MKPSFIISKKTLKKTDDYYIKNIIVETPYIYCYGKIKKDDYLCTCPIYGVAIVAGSKDVAFAIALEDKCKEYISPIKIKLL